VTGCSNSTPALNHTPHTGTESISYPLATGAFGKFVQSRYSSGRDPLTTVCNNLCRGDNSAMRLFVGRSTIGQLCPGRYRPVMGHSRRNDDGYEVAMCCAIGRRFRHRCWHRVRPTSLGRSSRRRQAGCEARRDAADHPRRAVQQRRGILQPQRRGGR